MTIAYLLLHYFYPSFTNNHKPKLIHTSTLVLLSVLLIVYQIILQIFPLTGLRILGYAANISPTEVIDLTNNKRQEVGASPLVSNPKLTEAARLKGEDMLANDYWAHTSPNGTEPWKFFSDVGYKYRYAGENLARDFSNPQSAIDAWMASPSHKENMLSTKYREIGIAVVEGDLNGVDTTIIVQLFGTQLADTSSQVPLAQAKPQVEAVLEPTITPTLVPTITPTPSKAFFIGGSTPPPSVGEIENIGVSEREEANVFRTLISPFESTRSVAVATTALLLIVLVIDGIVVARRNITRVGGRTFAHIAFLGMILAILIIARVGEIL